MGNKVHLREGKERRVEGCWRCLKLHEKVWVDRKKGEQSSKWPKDIHSQQNIVASSRKQYTETLSGLGDPLVMTKHLQVAKINQFRQALEKVGVLEQKNLCAATPERKRLWPRCGMEAAALSRRKTGDRSERKAQTREASGYELSGGRIKGYNGSGSYSVTLKT